MDKLSKNECRRSRQPWTDNDEIHSGIVCGG